MPVKNTSYTVIVFSLQTPPRSRRLHEGFGTLPKDRDTDSARKNKGFASFGKGFFKLKNPQGKWRTSAPNLGDGCCLFLIAKIISKSIANNNNPYAAGG